MINQLAISIKSEISIFEEIIIYNFQFHVAKTQKCIGNQETHE